MHVPFLSDKGTCTTLVVYVDKKEEESHFCMSANSGRIYISDSDLAPPMSIDIHHGETSDDIFEKVLELNLSDNLGITNNHIKKIMLTYDSIV